MRRTPGTTVGLRVFRSVCKSAVTKLTTQLRERHNNNHKNACVRKIRGHRNNWQRSSVHVGSVVCGWFGLFGSNRTYSQTALRSLSAPHTHTHTSKAQMSLCYKKTQALSTLLYTQFGMDTLSVCR